MKLNLEHKVIFENYPECVSLLALDGTLLEINPAGLRLLEADSVQQLQKQSFYSLVAEEHRPAFRELVEGIFRGESGLLEFQIRGLKGTHRWLQIHASALREESSAIAAMLGITQDITRQKQAEQERIAHVHFLESMDLVNRAIQSTNDLKKMLSEVLDAVLMIFNCDRAWLLHPCDPEAPFWHIPMERTRPEYPGAFALGMELPADADVAAVFRIARDSKGPVKFGSGERFSIPAEPAKRFAIQSMILMAIYPKVGKPYMFGIHQCSRPRVWTREEERLMEEIGRRVADALTTFLMVERLEESESKLEEAQRIAHIGYWENDLVTDTISWSDETFRIFGFRPKEHMLDFCKVQAFVHPEDRRKVVDAIVDLLADLHPYDLEHRILRPNGEVRFVHSRGNLTKDSAGQPIRIFGTIQDITESKLANQALRDSQEHLTALIQSVDGIVWEGNAQTFQFTYVSPQAERMLGYPVSSWLNEPSFWADHLYPEDREQAIRYCIKQTREKLDHEFEYRIIAADGRIVWLRDIVTVLVENNVPVKLRGIMVDITAQKQADQRIRQLNRTHAVLSEINQLIVRVRETGRLLAGACKIAVEKGGFRLAWIALMNRSTGQLELIAHAGADPATVDAINTAFANLQQSCPFSAEVLQTGRPIACNNIAQYPMDPASRDAAIQRGYQSMLYLPLTAGKEHVGVFGLYSGEPEFFDADEIRLLDELAADVAFALEVCEGEQGRQRALEQLRTSEERFRELAETIEDAFWVTDPTGEKIFYISPAYEKIWGRSCQSLYDEPTSWLKTIYPEDQEKAEQLMTKCQKDGCFDEEYRIIRSDGQVRWIRDQGFPIRNSQGHPERVVGVARDITERRQAQEKIRAANARYARQEVALMSLTRACALRQASIPELIHEITQVAAQTLDVERVSIWRYDRNGRGIVCRDLFQRSSKTHVSDMALHVKDFPSYFKALAEGNVIAAHDAFHDPRTEEFAASYLLPNGIASMLDAPIHMGGKVAGVICSEHVGAPRQWTSDEQTFAIAVANVVSLLLAEEERQQIEEQFRQSQKMEAIGQLAGGVAHDFNNILAAMVMQVDLAEMTENVPQDVRDSLQQIRTAAKSAGNLTRQLLLFSRRQVMQPRELDLNEVVTSLAKMLQRIIGEDIRLQLHLNPTPLLVHADAGMLDQLLMNLAVNARDAMPQGGRLLIETSEKTIDESFAELNPDTVPGRYVQLSVSDTGKGIPTEVLPHIFEPFFTTKEPGKGTGLGLATVFGVVKQHHGWIHVASEPDQGASFQVCLPASNASAEAIEAANAARPKPVGGSETILLAEDAPSVRRTTRLFLERNGYHVLEAANGVEALKLWEQQHDSISLLLTDLVMPAGISGQQLARKLQQGQPKLKVIFTSGYSSEIAGRELELRPGENFLQKPFPPEQLLETIRHCLDD